MENSIENLVEDWQPSLQFLLPPHREETSHLPRGMLQESTLVPSFLLKIKGGDHVEESCSKKSS
jgi:hypothetical protein